MRLGPWHASAALLARAAGWAARTAGRGEGVAMTGKVLVTVAPDAVDRLAAGRRIVLVSGTNGKSTTTRLLAEAWAVQGPVTWSAGGANLLSGVAHTLLTTRHERVVLEVDELALPEIVRRTRPAMVVLLNVARDQLDRLGEMSEVVRRWSATLRTDFTGEIVANADDPRLVRIADGLPDVTWVGAGLLWREDARACQRCAHALEFRADTWWCPGCGLTRPAVRLQRLGSDLILDGTRTAGDLQLPGEASAANAAMALAAAERLGVPVDQALPRMRSVTDVGGRFAQGLLHGRQVRLLLMKNPASAWSVLDLVSGGTEPVLLVLNAEIADGRDPSWLWDVPFERLRGRPVVVTGRRAADLSVRLTYAEVPHTTAPDVATGLAALPPGRCDVVANYTAFTAVSRGLA